MREVVGLFSGIGGFELGLAAHGFETGLVCDVNPESRAVLGARFPGATVVDDVRAMDALPPGAGVLTAGFPCQDLSTSGAKAGIDGERSGLVSHVFRLLARRPVDWVILENVPNILKLAKGAGMDVVVSGFERLGYRWAYRTVDSINFGLPQRRRRVFLVATLSGDPREVLLADDAASASVGFDPGHPVGFYWTEGRYGASLVGNGVPTIKGGSSLGIPSPPAILMPDGSVGTPDIRDIERLQGFGEGWTEPAAGMSKGMRWKLVGNAVSVPVTEWIGGRLASPATYDASGDAPLDARRWPSAGWNVGDGRHASAVGESPLGSPRPGIAEFLAHPLRPLSAKAAAGFVARVNESRARYPVEFAEAMRAYAAAAGHQSAAGPGLDLAA